MGERIRTGYNRLFEIRVLHHYWLDEGTTVFDTIADTAVKDARLLDYDVRRTLSIRPSRNTSEAISGLGGVFRTTGLGIVVAVPDGTIVADTEFDFFVTVVAADYASYTALTLRPRSIVDVTDPNSKTIHRYKENVPLLSNLTGAKRGTGANTRLFLSTEYATGVGDFVEALVTSNDKLDQLLGDPPNAPIRELGSIADHPVFVHQGDAQRITPPAGSHGAPARGIELTDDTPSDVVAVLHVVPVRQTDQDFSLVDAQGHPRQPHPIFEVHLRNRWTTWRYHDRGTGSVTATEAAPLPLTYFGNAGTGQKPTSGAVTIEKAAANSSRISRLVSEIFI